MVDDFHIIMGKRTVHVCNAPSPAATASIEIGKEVVSRIPDQSHLSNLHSKIKGLKFNGKTMFILVLFKLNIENFDQKTPP